MADVVVSYYGINLSARGAGGAYAYHAGDAAKATFEMPFGYYGQAVYFAAAAARYQHEFGLTSEQLGAVAMAARQHAERTPNALRREPLSLEDYLANPLVADPLRKLDCCLVNDGGVAYVMTSLERARHLRHPPVVVAGAALGSKPVTQAQYFSQSSSLLTTAASISGPLAFKRAGLTPADVDVAAIYDCFTISMLLQLEDLGFAAKGEGAAPGRVGRPRPGRLPAGQHPRRPPLAVLHRGRQPRGGGGPPAARRAGRGPGAGGRGGARGRPRGTRARHPPPDRRPLR